MIPKAMQEKIDELAIKWREPYYTEDESIAFKAGSAAMHAELEPVLRELAEALGKIKLKATEEVTNLEESDAKLSACYVLSKSALDKLKGVIE